MVDSTKIKNGTFAGSYTAPKRRRWGRIILVGTLIVLIAGVAGGLVWRNEMSKRMDNAAYQVALKSSEGIGYEYLNSDQRNAQFQKHAGITMDAYLKKPRTIKSQDDKYKCAQLLEGALEYQASVGIYRELIEGADASDPEIGKYLEGALTVAVGANDRDAYDWAYARYDGYLKTGDFADDYREQKLEMFRWYDEN